MNAADNDAKPKRPNWVHVISCGSLAAGVAVLDWFGFTSAMLANRKFREIQIREGLPFFAESFSSSPGVWLVVVSILVLC